MTAYRIFKILQWLQERPHSIEELNERFKDEPLIGKTLSSDTIWLDMNTLKELGCQITRPAPSNDFRHELLYHPFGLPLTSKELAMLKRVKGLMESHFTFNEMQLFERLLVKVARSSFIPGETEDVESQIQSELSLEDDQDSPWLALVQRAIDRKELLEVTYLSPVNGEEKLYILPESILSRRGSLYMKGSQHGRSQLSMLRLDRIVAIDSAKHRNDIVDDMMDSLGDVPSIRFQLMGVSEQEVRSILIREELTPFENDSGSGVEVQIQTRDFFMVQQIIFSFGVPFRILEPEPFRQQLIQALESMAELYTSQGRELSASNGGDSENYRASTAQALPPTSYRWEGHRS